LKSIHLSAHKILQERLVEARNAAGLTQEELAGMLGRPQSFVSKVESGDRRLDVVEYVQWTHCVGIDPGTIISALAINLDRGRRRRGPTKV